MRGKSFYSFFIFLLIAFPAVSQKKGAHFQSINQVGVAAGQSEPDLVYQTINGIKKGDLFVGAGVGVDDYQYKTLPVFIDGRGYFGDRKQAFAYGDIGYSFMLKNKPGKEIYYTSYDFTGGIYTDVGLGFETKLYKGTSLLFSIGHSYKELKNKIGVSYCGVTGPCTVDYSKYEYKYGRIVVKAGFVF